MALRKIDAETNVITWFEIPVADMARAQKFYETILDIKMNPIYMEEIDEEMVSFPAVPGVIQASSGRVTGILVKNKDTKPSREGTLVYLNASPSIQDVIDRIEPAGGQILVPAKEIKAGYFAVFLDTEGNRVALHAEE